ncbi:MAG: 16S rRNA (adenine(1518)-N(6)/adenine(1519)-N(6))-dimethyltransferase RsmA [Coriobacteriia bacterium]|nr:16S rRNA (adenine(1518)-N(6)/adenine(1519)-N(6))-dimethyltransferase RsmA [Coriobacteriia bacterium]
MSGSPLASPSATLAVLQRHGLYTKKSLGQHFLVDDNVVKRIVDLAEIDPTGRVLEIGPGIGTLTLALCDAAGSVVAVERDDKLLPVLAEMTAACGNLDIVRADAVSVSFDTLQGDEGLLPTAMVANLPYGVAATVVLRFLEGMESLCSATVMVQAEVADRMAAVPGTKAYGAYTVKLGLLAEVKGRFAVARTCFFPPPRVDSAVIRLERVSRSEPQEVLEAAARVAEAAFAQRRKTLRNSLKATLGSGFDVDRMLESAGIDGGLRAETLGVEDFVILGAELHTQRL